MKRPRLFVGLALPAALALAACRVDDQAFQDRVFACDTSAADPLCGTDAQGNPMQCFAARQIGATDFCTPQCDGEPMSLPAESAVCVQGHALLKACNPNDDQDLAAHPNGACDRAEFGCLRTNVIGTVPDEGVCLTMKTCTVDKDCRDPVRSTCAATFLSDLYRGNPDLHANNLYCLQEGCQQDRTSCSPGESCLRDVIAPGAGAPDICVPKCDSNGQCPPNHFCLRQISGPANPAVCIPGLLGFVCQTDVDCLVGSCTDDGGTGPGRGDNLLLCSTDCMNDSDCAKFDSAQGQFVCNTDSGKCATPNAYRGPSCNDDSDCVRDPDSICVRFARSDLQGTCLHGCEADGSCRPRGGINQTCVPLVSAATSSELVCLPGFFGLPCFSDANCVGDLSCRGADLSTGTPGSCTVLCEFDADCAKDRWAIGGWCATGSLGVCYPPLDDGADCARNEMCSSGFCDLDGAAASHTCKARQ